MKKFYALLPLIVLLGAGCQYTTKTNGSASDTTTGTTNRGTKIDSPTTKVNTEVKVKILPKEQGDKSETKPTTQGQ